MKRDIHALVLNHPQQDFPAKDLREICRAAMMDGMTVHPKFTCEHCGDRVYSDLINEFPSFMECPKCHGVHDFEKTGGNYLMSCLPVTSEDYPDAQAAFKVWRKQNHGY